MDTRHDRRWRADFGVSVMNEYERQWLTLFVIIATTIGLLGYDLRRTHLAAVFWGAPEERLEETLASLVRKQVLEVKKGG